MLLRIVLLMEVVSMVVSIYRIYGKKFQPKLEVILLISSLVFILEVINEFSLSKVLTVGLYVILLIYCKMIFKESFFKTLISIYLLVVILTIVQFIGLLIVSFFVHDNEYIRAFISNLGILLFSIFVLPKFHVEKLRNSLCSNNAMLVVLNVTGFVIIFLLLQDKLLKKIQVELFIFAIPMVAAILFLLDKWNRVEIIAFKAEKELENNLNMQEKYADFLKDVRLRQHEFKNHIAAIFSTHYTYKTYENLVQAQKEYCTHLMTENKYNSLLLIGNNVLAGFLYEKFLEIDDDEILLEYKIHATLANISIPIYHVIEMLGILLDNAVEALKGLEDKRIYFEIFENNDNVCFIVRNVYRYVEYAEIEQWFQEGVSSKGIYRGIGLHHVRERCKESESNICCKNISLDDKNWIEFELKIAKDG